MITIEFLKAVLGLGKLRSPSFRFPDRRHHLLEFFRDPHGDLQNRRFLRITSFLGQISHQSVFIANDSTLIGVLFPENDFKESRLTGTVGSDKGDALAPVDRQLCVFKENTPPKGFGHFFDRQHGGADVRRDGLRVKKFEAWRRFPSAITQKSRFGFPKRL